MKANKTVRGRAGRDRHRHAGAAGLLAGTAGSASARGFPAFVGPLHTTS